MPLLPQDLREVQFAKFAHNLQALRAQKGRRGEAPASSDGDQQDVSFWRAAVSTINVMWCHGASRAMRSARHLDARAAGGAHAYRMATFHRAARISMHAYMER